MNSARRCVIAWLLAAGCAPVSGCVWTRQWFGPRDPFGPQAPCALRPDATAAEVVAHLNQNAARMPRWKADRVKIRAAGAAVDLDANLAVAAPRYFRLKARALLSEEIDLGSNQDEFWFWSKRSPSKEVFVARHDEDSSPQRPLPVPFQPDWIMEALGVIPVDPALVTLEPGAPGTGTVRLVADSTSPDGRPVRKVTVVARCHGVVREQALYDEHGQPIAWARMYKPRRVGPTQAVMPERIDLVWPQADLSLTMYLGPVEMDPPHMPATMWEVPNSAPRQVHPAGR